MQEPCHPSALCLKDWIVLVKNCPKKSEDQSMVVIYTTEPKSDHTEVVVRKLRQLEWLKQYIEQQYGGHIIPTFTADLYNHTQNAPVSQQLLTSIQHYLNDLKDHRLLNRDSKLRQFLFKQSVKYEQQSRFDRLLSSAAKMSRTFLNSLFTRRESEHVSSTKLDGLHQQIKAMTLKASSLLTFAQETEDETQSLEELLSTLSLTTKSLSQAVPPFVGLNSKRKSQISRLITVFKQAEEAFKRWSVLSETVKEAYANLNKGIHEEPETMNQMVSQLNNWTNSLQLEMDELCKQAAIVIEGTSKDLLVERKLHFKDMWLSFRRTSAIQRPALSNGHLSSDEVSPKLDSDQNAALTQDQQSL